jgi:GT2 family glycosyltransferase
MSNNKKLLVSILNWNNAKATICCLESIAKLDVVKQPTIHLIDNHSEKEPLEIDPSVSEKLRDLRALNNVVNRGFAGGHNQSIALAKKEGFEYILLLNNDTQIVDQALFEKLTQALDDTPDAIAAAPLITEACSDVVWFGGGAYSKLWGATKHLRVGESAKNVPKETTSVPFLTGCCLLLRVEGLETLPEDYFVYWEDAEWSIRMGKQHKKLLFVPSTQIAHAVSSSLGIASPYYVYYNIRNNILFVKRNTPKKYLLPALLRVVYVSKKEFVKIFVRYRSQRFVYTKALFEAWCDGLAGKGGKWKHQP